ncbi:hypothetical protein [Acidaminobacterium chupaoyuni]
MSKFGGRLKTGRHPQGTDALLEETDLIHRGSQQAFFSHRRKPNVALPQNTLSLAGMILDVVCSLAGSKPHLFCLSSFVAAKKQEQKSIGSAPLGERLTGETLSAPCGKPRAFSADHVQPFENNCAK